MIICNEGYFCGLEKVLKGKWDLEVIWWVIYQSAEFFMLVLVVGMIS